MDPAFQHHGFSSNYINETRMQSNRYFNEDKQPERFVRNQEARSPHLTTYIQKESVIEQEGPLVDLASNSQQQPLIADGKDDGQKEPYTPTYNITIQDVRKAMEILRTLEKNTERCPTSNLGSNLRNQRNPDTQSNQKDHHKPAMPIRSRVSALRLVRKRTSHLQNKDNHNQSLFQQPKLNSHEISSINLDDQLTPNDRSTPPTFLHSQVSNLKVNRAPCSHLYPNVLQSSILQQPLSLNPPASFQSNTSHQTHVIKELDFPTSINVNNQLYVNNQMHPTTSIHLQNLSSKMTDTNVLHLNAKEGQQQDDNNNNSIFQNQVVNPHVPTSINLGKQFGSNNQWIPSTSTLRQLSPQPYIVGSGVDPNHKSNESPAMQHQEKNLNVSNIQPGALDKQLPNISGTRKNICVKNVENKTILETQMINPWEPIKNTNSSENKPLQDVLLLDKNITSSVEATVSNTTNILNNSVNNMKNPLHPRTFNDPFHASTNTNPPFMAIETVNGVQSVSETVARFDKLPDNKEISSTICIDLTDSNDEEDIVNASNRTRAEHIPVREDQTRELQRTENCEINIQCLTNDRIKVAKASVETANNCPEQPSLGVGAISCANIISKSENVINKSVHLRQSENSSRFYDDKHIVKQLVENAPPSKVNGDIVDMNNKIGCTNDCNNNFNTISPTEKGNTEGSNKVNTTKPIIVDIKNIQEPAIEEDVGIESNNKGLNDEVDINGNKDPMKLRELKMALDETLTSDIYLNLVINWEYIYNLQTILECTNATLFRQRRDVGCKCYFCNLNFNNPSDLKKHVIYSHRILNKTVLFKIKRTNFVGSLDITDLYCKLCGLSISTLEDSIIHLNEFHNKMFHKIKNQIRPFIFKNDLLLCGVCLKRFENFNTLFQHLNTHYNNFPCKICNAACVAYHELMKHESLVHKTDYFSCNFCFKRYTKINDIQKHIMEYHGPILKLKDMIEKKQTHTNGFYESMSAAKRNMVVEPLNVNDLPATLTERASIIVETTKNVDPVNVNIEPAIVSGETANISDELRNITIGPAITRGEVENISDELRNIRDELRNVSDELRNISDELRNVTVGRAIISGEAANISEELGNITIGPAIVSGEVANISDELRNKSVESANISGEQRNISVGPAVIKAESQNMNAEISLRCHACNMVFMTLENYAGHSKKCTTENNFLDYSRKIVVKESEGNCQEDVLRKNDGGNKDFMQFEYLSPYYDPSPLMIVESSDSETEHLDNHQLHPSTCQSRLGSMEIITTSKNIDLTMTPHDVGSPSPTVNCRRQLDAVSQAVKLTVDAQKGQKTIDFNKPLNVEEKDFNTVAVILNCTNATLVRSQSRDGYLCYFCNARFWYPSSLKRHSLETHKNISINDFANKIDFPINLDVTELRCNICEKEIDSFDVVIEHLNLHDNQLYMDVENDIVPLKFTNDNPECICSRTFDNLTVLLDHARSHYRELFCESCGSGFITSYGLSIHQKTHSITAFSCLSCDKKFKTRNLVLDHEVRVHYDMFPHVCEGCGDRFKRIQEKELHVMWVHRNEGLQRYTRTSPGSIPKEILLPEDKYFSNLNIILNYTNATLIHSKEVFGYVCYFCSKYFELPANLKKHALTSHTVICRTDIYRSYHLRNINILDITGLCCIPCENNFMSLKEIKCHLETVHQELFYIDPEIRTVPIKFKIDKPLCGLCMVEFEWHSLITHVSCQYTDYRCNACGVGFVDKTNLEHHIQSNDEVHGNFVCNVCTERFNNDEVLNEQPSDLNHALYDKYDATTTVENIQPFLEIIFKYKDEKALQDEMVLKGPQNRRVETQYNNMEVTHKCHPCNMVFTTWDALSVHIKTCTYFTSNFVGEVVDKNQGNLHSDRKITRHRRKKNTKENTYRFINSTNDSSGVVSENDKLFQNIKTILEWTNATLIRDGKRKSKYQCYFCRRYFEKPIQLKTHNAKLHTRIKREKIKIPVETQTFVVHMDTTHLKCKLCDSNIDNLRDLFTHLNKDHKVVMCDEVREQILAIKFQYNVNGTYYNRMCKYNFLCDTCNKRFLSRKSLETHVRSSHQGGSSRFSLRFTCGFCNERFRYSKQKEMHLKIVHSVIPSNRSKAPATCQSDK